MAIPGDEQSTGEIAAAHAHFDAGRYGEALTQIVDALSRQPGDGQLLFARASLLFDWGRVREAREGFVRAEAAGLASTALYLNLAWSCHLLHADADAERYARKAVALEPVNVATHFGLGTVLQRLNRFPEAIASYERALELSPDYAEGAIRIAHCKLEQREYVSAETWVRRAIALAPEQPQYWTNLGVALGNQERYAEALDALKHAEELERAQDLPRESTTDTGFALILTGQDHAAAELYRRNLPEVPDPRAHGNYALTLLTLGQFREGWQQYEFRWLRDPHLSNRPNFSQPRWAGQDLTGKTILLRAEQGAGDIIHFSRYAATFKAMGATVVMQVRPEITALANGFAGVDLAFAPPTPPPRFDYFIHLMSIPQALGTELTTIPTEVPYVRVDPELAQRWTSRIDGSGMKIGLAWAGNPSYPRDRFRSIPLDKLRGLWNLPDVRFYSLQKPLKPGDLENFPQNLAMTNLGPDLTDFADTAAAISRLDLVICVDTAIAHLAGALGKPVWLMLPEIGDFRWLEGRDDSPWYPTMRLFRQRRLGEWDEVVARVCTALREAASTGSLTVPATQSRLPDSSASTGEATCAPASEQCRAAAPSSISRVTETRYGIMQYVPDGDRSARSIAWYGEFLQAQLDLISRLVPAAAHVVEVDSGIGEHALWLARMVGTQGHLLLYEPRKVIQRILRQNLDANQLTPNVTVMQRNLAPDGRESSETLDDLLLERLDLLKIRSKEAAADVLEGASDTLWRLRPTLFIAVKDPTSANTLGVQVKAFGYRCWQMQTPLFERCNFNRRDTDIFAAEAAWALLAIPEEVDCAVALDGCVEM